MDHIVPGYREHRLRHPQRAYTARILAWATLGAVTGLLLVPVRSPIPGRCADGTSTATQGWLSPASPSDP